MLPSDQGETLPEIPLLPWCPRPQDPHLRRRHEEERSRRVPLLRPPRLLGEGERLQRGSRGCAYRLQQVHGEIRRKRCVPFED